jgi:tetratricopeptide (TPR) repeat protein
MLQADVYWQEQRLAKADALYLRALKARTHLLGPDHADTIEAVGKLAALYRAQGRYAEAEPLFRMLLEAARRSPNGENKEISLRSDLAGIFRAEGRHQEANALALAPPRQ